MAEAKEEMVPVSQITPKSMDVLAFKTFELPTYEVRTPHTGLVCTMQSFTVEQEERYKTSTLSTQAGLAEFNKILWECMFISDKNGNKTKPFASPGEMTRKLTLNDRMALIYAAIITSYGEKQSFVIPVCPGCGQRYEVEGDLSTSAAFTPYTGTESLLTKVVDVELPISKYHAFIKSPTLFDEMNFAASVGLKKEVMNKALEYLSVVKMAVPTEDPNKFRNIDNILEIYACMTKLSTRDRKFLNKRIMEEFGEYTISVKIPAKCPICGFETETEVSLLSELFRFSH